MTPIEAAIEAVRKQQANIFSADKLARAAVKAYLDAAATQVASTGVHATEDFFGVSPMAAPTQEVYALRKAAEANNVPSVANVAVNAEGLWGSKTPPGGDKLTYPASVTIQVPAQAAARVQAVAAKVTAPFLALGKKSPPIDQQLEIAGWLSKIMVDYGIMEHGDILNLDESVYVVDSLDHLELTMAAEEEYDIELHDTALESVRTWRDFVKVIEDRIS